MKKFLALAKILAYSKFCIHMFKLPLPPPKRVNWNKRNTEQRVEGPNYNYFILFFGINSIIFRKDSEWRY